jgi:hypothetical protein
MSRANTPITWSTTRGISVPTLTSQRAGRIGQTSGRGRAMPRAIVRATRRADWWIPRSNTSGIDTLPSF